MHRSGGGVNFAASNKHRDAMKTITATPNHARKTFTIRTGAGKYRTTRMSKDEFNSCLHHTSNDWANWLHSCGDYYRVKSAPCK